MPQNGENENGQQVKAMTRLQNNSNVHTGLIRIEIGTATLDRQLLLKHSNPRYVYPSKICAYEHRRIDAFKLWCWIRLLRVPWTARRSNQSILQEINPEYSLEELMLKLKFQYFGHLVRRDNSLGKTLILGKIEGRRRKGQESIRWVHSINH